MNANLLAPNMLLGWYTQRELSKEKEMTSDPMTRLMIRHCALRACTVHGLMRVTNSLLSLLLLSLLLLNIVHPFPTACKAFFRITVG